jgi:hypothetical protein
MSLSFPTFIDDNTEEEEEEEEDDDDDIDMKEESGIKFMILLLRDKQGTFLFIYILFIFGTEV